MANLQDGGRGFDRSYKRGAVMGLTVAEAFILLSFCLLLLFTWWQVDTERRSLLAADRIAELTPEQKEAIIKGLSDGTFDLATALRKAGTDLNSPDAIERVAEYSRFMREEDFKRLMDAVVNLSPETRLSLAEVVEVSDEAMLRSALAQAQTGDSTADTIAARLEGAAQQEGALVGLLEQRLGDTIRAAGGSIDARGTITLPQAVLFDVGQQQVKNPQFLIELCSTWLAALRESELELSDLKIEGHASSEGAVGQSPEQAYLYNLDLSQRRAQSALGLCLGGVEDPEVREWARQHLAAIGYSSARLIHNPDGSEDREASRRVMFSVGLNQKGLIEEIKRDVASDDVGQVVMSAIGPARVIDGDTIEIHGTSFRLSGIDAPEMGQPCVSSEGVSFDCGEVARRGLAEIVAGREVLCTAETIDLYRHPVAVCLADGADLAEAMVVNGYAMPSEEYSDAYLAQGVVAKASKIGIWSTVFDKPWEYRKPR
jgi:endonuclease YncB( thermonuclease family)